MKRYSVRVICRPEVALGFALAGVPTAEANSTEDAHRVMNALAASEETGVLLVQEDLFDGYVEPRHGERALPMIVPFPGPATRRGSGGPEGFVAEILRQAIGYRVRLQ